MHPYGIVLLAIWPVLYWLGRALGPGLGADPAAYLLRASGWWSLVLLMATLLLPLLARACGRPGWLAGRRVLGLAAFSYAALHLLGWAWWECNLVPAWMGRDILQRPFVLIGVLGFAPLLLLALTSTAGWKRRLGAWWFRLHRGIHVAAVLSVVHFWLVREGKNDLLEPTVFAVLLGGLWLVRRLWRPAPR